MEIILQILSRILDILIILSPFFPLIIAMVRYVGKKNRNQNMILLAQRADIIVAALKQQPIELTNAEKAESGIKKLVEYANEVGIKLTEQQANDYIEHAYSLLKERTDRLG